MGAPKVRLDRFATLRAIVERFPEIAAHKRHEGSRTIAGGHSACLAAVVLFERADARTGTVFMSVSRLAKLICCTRDTARRALAVLLDLEVIYPFERNGTAVGGRYEVAHVVWKDNGG